MSEKAGAKIVEPTAKEAMFFLLILSNMKNKPDVDWTVVAEKASLSNAATASTRYGQIKKKLGFTKTYVSPADPGSKAARGKKMEANGSGTNLTPARVTKKRSPSKPKALKAKPEYDFEPKKDEEDHNVKQELTVKQGDGGISGFEDDAPYMRSHLEIGNQYT
ncbi:hypothetical protein QTJ16_006162 [Diplocarpon rosae]|uniref:Myb-like DNA-binding domain-containing protein n=1 Tax=Diplocarpon rosae TaxID=946125 RepID=A0AAD9WA98_9HELO|nr:hypothetical protein QTJ16_006162 [Diplocarpon rosae]